MDIIVRTIRDTNVYNKPIPIKSFIDSKLEKDTQLHIYGKTKYGLDTLYQIAGNKYIEANNIQILRDMDFYYKNYSSNILSTSNINLNGGKGISALENPEEYTSAYMLLTRFGPFDDEFGGTVEANTILPDKNKQSYNDIYGIPSYGTSFDYNEPLTTNPNSILNGVSLGGLIDGSSIGTAVGNIIGKITGNVENLVGGWYNDLINFVIGFTDASGISVLKDLFYGKWLQTSSGIRSIINSSNTPERAINREYRMTADMITYDTSRTLYSKQFESRQIKLSERTTAMKKYFSFYYESRSNTFGNIVDTSRIREWGKDNSVYDTNGMLGTPERPKEEVAFYKSIDSEIDKDGNWTNMWKDALATIREEFNLDIDRKTIFEKFNRFRVPTPDNELTSTHGYVYFTRPDLNTDMMKLVGNKVFVGTAHSYPLMANMNKQHGILMKYLLSSRDKVGCNHDFIPILTHACTGFDISDEVLETDETGETFTGWKFVYGKSLTKSKTAGTVNITFTDDNMLSVYKIFKVWTEYIHAVSRGECDPFDVNANKHILDYAISIYYFLTKANGEDILFFTKLTGCFPTAVPSSNFSDTLGTPIKRPNYTIPFIYTRKDDYNPIFLAEFNHLSDPNNHEAIPIYNDKTLRVHKSFVGAPFVHTTDGMYTYQLKHRAADG